MYLLLVVEEQVHLVELLVIGDRQDQSSKLLSYTTMQNTTAYITVDPYFHAQSP